METNTTLAEGRGQGSDIRGEEVKRAMGRRSRARDILPTILADAQRAITRSEKNDVGKSLLILALENPNTSLWNVNPVKTVRKIDPATGKVALYEQADTFGDDIFKMRVNGQTYAIKLDLQLASSMKNLGAANLNAALRFTGGINRWLSSVNTALNPEFLITNFMRDFEQALIQIHGERGSEMANAVAKDVLGLGPAMGALSETSGEGVIRSGLEAISDSKTAEWSEWFRKYRESGGKISYFRQESIPEQRRRIEKLLKLGENTTEASVRRGLNSVWELVENLNGAVENAVRVATYKNALTAIDPKTGKPYTQTDAAHMARDLTVNFNRRGEYGVAMNSLYLFYNASIQGLYRFGVAYKNKKVRSTINKAMAFQAGLTILNYMLAGDDEDGENRYEKIPDYEKSRNLIIMTPGGEPIKIPLPYVINAFLAIPENVVAVAFGREPGKASANVVHAVLESTVPIYDRDWLNMVAPTVLDPFIDIADNKNFFGGQIMPQNDFEDYVRPESDKYWKSVNPFFLTMAKGMNQATGGSDTTSGLVDISPEALEYMFDHFTGAAGAFINRSITTAANPADAFAENKVPFLRKMYGANTRFYASDQYQAATERVEAYTQALSRIDRQQYGPYSDFRSARNEFIDDNEKIASLAPLHEATEKRLRRAYKMRRQTMEGDLPDKEKEKRLDEIEARIDQHRAEFNLQYNKTFFSTGIG